MSDRIAGVDEAGRGAWAGSVFAAAVILNPERPIEGLRDSKKLSAKRREVLYGEIMEKALAVGVGFALPEEIDALNILQATLLAMRRAIEALTLLPTQIFVDGNQLPRLSMSIPMQALIGGDDLVPAISAASIIAKVTRDREMLAFAERYPDYAFEVHKGYGTAKHQAALAQYGSCPLHRKSFAPIRRVCERV